jgi:hypothetical protein
VTRQTKQELLRLIDALCEGTASAGQTARLESLVLADRDCLRLYLEAMELHGLLHWDAAGIGATLEEDWQPATAHPANPVEGTKPQRAAQPASPGTAVPSANASRRHRALRGGLAACLALVLVSVVLLTGYGWSLWEQGTVVDHPTAPSPPESAPSVAESDDVRRIHLPPVPAPQSSPSESLTDDEPSPQVAETQPILRASSDEEVLRFVNERLQAAWEQHEVQPSAKADDAEWVRRVYLDLAGRIPTPEEAQEFFQDKSPEKRGKLVDRLLESRDFAGNFASIWTNLLVGRSADRQIDRGQLLAWLEFQFGENRSWRESVSDLLTAEGPAEESGPANFLLAHLNNEAVPATAITARILLCEQLQCSQCHQHPHAKNWQQDRFWGFNAFFQQTQVRRRLLVDQETGERRRIRELVDRPTSGPTFYETLQGVMQVAYPRYEGTEIEFDEQTPLRRKLAELICSGERPQIARAFVNRNWQHFFGHAFTNPVDDMGPHNHPSHPDLLDGLADAFADSGFDVHRLIRWICLSDAYHLSSRPAPENVADAPDAGERPLFSRMYIKPLSAEQLFNSLMIASGVSPRELYRRGEAYARREQWLQQFFTAVETEENSETTTLDGSLTQALMMMNGELVQRAIHPEQSRVLSRIVSGSKSNVSEVEKIRQLSLAALSRYPTSEELAAIRQALRSQVRQRTESNVPPQVAVNEGLRDLYWAYLNSSEFAMNR